MKKKLQPGAKMYRLKKQAAPLTYTLPSRSNKRAPLHYYDEEKKESRELRYARNQKSPFVDEQDGNAIMEPIIFEEGFLTVPRTNPVLQRFLELHPAKDRVYEEIDPSQDAQKEVDKFLLESKIVSTAASLTKTEITAVGSMFLGRDVSKWPYEEILKDVIIAARKRTQEFFRLVDDPSIRAGATIDEYFKENLIQFRANQTELWLNLPKNKRKLMQIPPDADAREAATQYLHTDEGLEVTQYIDDELSQRRAK